MASSCVHQSSSSLCKVKCKIFQNFVQSITQVRVFSSRIFELSTEANKENFLSIFTVKIIYDKIFLLFYWNIFLYSQFLNSCIDNNTNSSVKTN